MKIKKALARLNVLAVAASNGNGMSPDDGELISEALEEWRVIERAAKTWWARDDVMERIEDAGHGGFEIVRSIAKEAP